MAYNPFMIGFTNTLLQGVTSYFDKQRKDADEEYRNQQAILASLLQSENPEVQALAISGLQNPKQLTVFGKLKENPAYSQIVDIVKRVHAVGSATDAGADPKQAAQQVGLPQAVQSAQASGALPPMDPNAAAALGASTTAAAGAPPNPATMDLQSLPPGVAGPPAPMDQSAGMAPATPTQGGGMTLTPGAATAPPPATATPQAPAQTTPVSPAAAPPPGAPATAAATPAVGAPASPGQVPPPTSFQEIRLRAQGALQSYQKQIQTSSLMGKPTPANIIIENQLAKMAATAAVFEDQPLTPETYQAFKRELTTQGAQTERVEIREAGSSARQDERLKAQEKARQEHEQFMKDLQEDRQAFRKEITDRAEALRRSRPERPGRGAGKPPIDMGWYEKQELKIKQTADARRLALLRRRDSPTSPLDDATYTSEKAAIDSFESQARLDLSATLPNLISTEPPALGTPAATPAGGGAQFRFDPATGKIVPK